QLEKLLAVIESGDQKGVQTEAVGRGALRAVLKQVANYGQLALPDCLKERCESEVIRGVYLGAARDEETDYFPVPTLRRDHQRSPATVIAAVEIPSPFEKRHYSSQISALGRLV